MVTGVMGILRQERKDIADRAAEDFCDTRIDVLLGQDFVLS